MNELLYLIYGFICGVLFGLGLGLWIGFSIFYNKYVKRIKK